MIGHGMPVYTGYASQHGYGLGNVLGGLVRSAIPFIKPVVTSAGKKLLQEGVTRIQQKLNQSKSKRKKVIRSTRKSKRRKQPRDIFA